MYTHRILITPADFAPLARQLTEAAAGLAGANMFQTPLSPSGSLPATHFISAGMIATEMAALLADPQLIVDATEGVVDLATATALLEASDISDEPAMDALARLELKLIQPTELPE
jgi:hypothetical protein